MAVPRGIAAALVVVGGGKGKETVDASPRWMRGSYVGFKVS